jgi:hypothetical protein
VYLPSLLRVRGERRCRRRSAQKRDELAACHFNHLVGAGNERRRILGPSAFCSLSDSPSAAMTFMMRGQLRR